MKPNKVDVTLILSEIELSILTVSMFIKFDDVDNALKETMSLIEKISDYLYLYNMMNAIVNVVKVCALKHNMGIDYFEFISKEVGYRLIK